MPKRVILRIEISANARQKYSDMLDTFGLIGVSTTSRLIEWVVNQDEETQALILDFPPRRNRSVHNGIVLRRIIDEMKRID
jgi:hypothetical protein